MPNRHTPLSSITRTSSHLQQNNQPNRQNSFQATGPRNFVSHELFNVQSSKAKRYHNRQNNSIIVPETSFQETASLPLNAVEIVKPPEDNGFLKVSGVIRRDRLNPE